MSSKISALTAASSALSSHELSVNESGSSRKVTLAQILDASRSTDPGAQTLATGTTLLEYDRVTLSSSNRLTMSGVAQAVLLNLRPTTPVEYRGNPKTTYRSFTVPDGWEYLVLIELALVNDVRVTLAGTCDLIVSDDFGTRSRIVLAGRG